MEQKLLGKIVWLMFQNFDLKWQNHLVQSRGFVIFPSMD